jgi:endoglucanase
VVIHCAGGPVRGVVCAKPIHQQRQDEPNKPPKVHELNIDIGATKKSEAEKAVKVGDFITMRDEWVELMGGKVAARGFDNKVGGVAVLEALRLLKTGKLSASVTAVSTVQEENTQGGAAAAAMNLKPDVVVVVDVGLATDYPGGSDNKVPESALGKGPVINVGSANHPLVVKRLEDVAKKKKIKIQRGICPNYTGTDADTVHKFGWGAPIAVVDVPLRYMHTPVETLVPADVSNAGKLLAEFCRSLKKTDDFKFSL